MQITYEKYLLLVYLDPESVGKAYLITTQILTSNSLRPWIMSGDFNFSIVMNPHLHRLAERTDMQI